MPTYCYAGNCQKCQEVSSTLYITAKGNLCAFCVREEEIECSGESWGGYNPGERTYSEAEIEQEKLRVEDLKKYHQIEFLESEVARLKKVITRRNRQLRALR